MEAILFMFTMLGIVVFCGVVGYVLGSILTKAFKL